MSPYRPDDLPPGEDRRVIARDVLPNVATSAEPKMSDVVIWGTGVGGGYTDWDNGGGKWSDHGYLTIEVDPYRCVILPPDICLTDHSEPWQHCHTQIDPPPPMP